MATKAELIAVVEEFIGQVRGVIALYSDATFGFGCYLENIKNNENVRLAFYRQRGIKRSKEEVENEQVITAVQTAVHFDSAGTHYSTAALHSSSSRETIERNKPAGDNEIRMVQLTLVMMYSIWEHSTRQKIETLLGTKVQIGILGELAQLRHCVLKSAGRVSSQASKKLSKVKFNQGDVIYLNGGDFIELLKIVGEELSNLVNSTFPPKKLPLRT